MTTNFRTSLNIQNNVESTAVAEACIIKVAELIGFDEHENKKIQLGLEEALSNVIKLSFAPGQTGDMDIEFRQLAFGLSISIRVKGIPFDPDMLPVYNPDKLEKDYNEQGLEIFLIKEMMDDYSFVNHGHEGMEVILTKYLSARSISDLIRSGIAKDIPAIGEEKKDKADFSVGHMKAEEAVAISRLAFYAYGYTYPYEDIYYPEKVAKLNDSGYLYSMLARLDDGKIIGHSALIREAAYGSNAELGIAFSDPQYRGMGIMDRLWGGLIDKAIHDHLCGIFAKTVTTHPYSQKAAHHFEMKDCCLLLSMVPVLKFKDIEEKKLRRESIMIIYRYLNPPNSIKIYPPDKHSSMIRRIFENLGIIADIQSIDRSANDLKGVRTRLTVDPDTAFVTVNIRIQKYGEDCIEKIARHLKHACIERYESIYLSLNLNDPFTALLCPEFEKMGFFFAGIQPGDEHNSYLVLQYLNNQQMDYNLLKLDSDFGKELAEYVKNCDPN